MAYWMRDATGYHGVLLIRGLEFLAHMSELFSPSVSLRIYLYIKYKIITISLLFIF
jgi:hypothetical protein